MHRTFKVLKNSQGIWIFELRILKKLFRFKFAIVRCRTNKYTGWTKITLPLLNTKYFWGLLDFLQKIFAITTRKGLQITCFKKKSFQNHTWPHQSSKFWGYQIFLAHNLENNKYFWKISPMNDLNCLNKCFYKEYQPFRYSILALEHFPLIK